MAEIGSVGIDFVSSQLCAAVWNGHVVEILSSSRNQELRFEEIRDEIYAHGVRDEMSDKYEKLYLPAVYNIKRLVGRINTDVVVQASNVFPLLVQTSNIGKRPFVATLVNKMWRSTPPEQLLAKFLTKLKRRRPSNNAILTVPVSFTRYQRASVQRACASVGIQNPTLIPEPTAVSL